MDFPIANPTGVPIQVLELFNDIMKQQIARNDKRLAEIEENNNAE